MKRAWVAVACFVPVLLVAFAWLGWKWFILVVCAGCLLGWAGWRLWRAARALLRELDRAMSVADTLHRDGGPAWSSPGPSIGDDDIELRARVARLRARRGLRRRARAARCRRTWARWAVGE